MTSLQIYLISRLDILLGMCIIFLVVGTIASLLYALHAVNDLGKNYNWFLLPVINAVFFSVCVVIIPDTKTMWAIVIMPKLYDAITQNKELKSIPNELVDVAKLWIEEMKPKKEIK